MRPGAASSAGLHGPSSRSTVFAVRPSTRTENLPSFFVSTSCANSSAVPSIVTSSSCVPAAKLRCETLRTPRTRCESAARKSDAVRNEGTLRTVTCRSFPDDTSLTKRAAIFFVMSCANARDAFLMASFPQERSSSWAAFCVVSAVERISPLSVFTARPEIVAEQDRQPGPRSATSPRALAAHPHRPRRRHANVLLGDQHHGARHALAGHQQAHRLEVLVQLRGADEGTDGDLDDGAIHGFLDDLVMTHEPLRMREDPIHPDLEIL